MLRRLDLQQAHERRLVLLLERDDVEHPQPLTAAAVDLLARLDHHRVGGFAEIVTVREWSLYLNTASSIPGPDGEDEPISGVRRAPSGAARGLMVKCPPSAQLRLNVQRTAHQSLRQITAVLGRGFAVRWSQRVG
jgi:hypothetical protein